MEFSSDKNRERIQPGELAKRVGTGGKRICKALPSLKICPTKKNIVFVAFIEKYNVLHIKLKLN